MNIKCISCIWGRLFAACCLAICSAAFANDAKVEQLLHQFDKAQDEGQVTDQIVSTANEFLKEMQMMEFFDDPIQFSNKDGLDTLRQQVWYWAAEWFYDQQSYTSATNYAQKALPLLHIPQEHADCLSLISICYARQGDYHQAARYAKQCYEIDRQRGDPDRMSSSLNTLASIYLGARQPQEAEKYILRGIELCQTVNNPGRLSILLGKASEVYHQLADDAKSLDYARQAYNMELSMGHKERIAIRLSQIASAYIGLKQHEAARDTLRRAIPMLELQGNRQQLGICCNQMGSLLLGEKNQQEAADYFERARTLFNQLGDRYNESIALNGLYKSLRDIDPAKALIHMERYNDLKDSIYDRETGQLLSEYAAQYGVEQLRLENLEVYRYNRTIIIISVIGSIVLLIFITLLYILLRHRTRRQHLELQRRLDLLKQDYDQLNSHYTNALATSRQNEDSNLTEADRQFLSRTLSIINTQIDEGHVNVDAVASELCMSTSQFRRRLTSLTGETPKNYIQAIRMQKARHLLDTRPDMPVSEMAVCCGYDETTNFTRAFKHFYGITPTEYLNNLRN